jgi:hypothetical protein
MIKSSASRFISFISPKRITNLQSVTSSFQPVNETSSGKHGPFVIVGLPLSALAFLLLTATVSLLWSHYKILTRDEFFVLWTDSVSSIGQVAHIQLTCPISLDPLAYHIIVHAAIHILGENAMAIRLLSLLGVLLMQICLFVFVRRNASERAAVFALGFSSLTNVLLYSTIGRPYGLMLGLFGLAMVSWQTAARREEKRIAALITLTLTIALTINIHYFGVLLLVPLCIAESFRTVQRRKFDLPVILAVGAGMTGIVFILPFMKAAAEFRAHYVYRLNTLKPAEIIRVYASVLSNHPAIRPVNAINLALFALVIAILGIALWAYIRRRCEKAHTNTQAETMFSVALAALPFFGYLLARFTSHTLDPHYCLGLVVGTSTLAALGLFSLIQSDRLGNSVLVGLFAIISFIGIDHILDQRQVTHEVLLSLNLTPATKAALTAIPGSRLYFLDTYMFALASYYEPDPDIRSRVALVYSRDQELRWIGSDTNALTELHMRNFTNFSISSYESLTTQPEDHAFVVRNIIGGYWLNQAFTASNAKVRHIGSGFGNEVQIVRFF